MLRFAEFLTSIYCTKFGSAEAVRGPYQARDQDFQIHYIDAQGDLHTEAVRWRPR